ncbi:MAG: N-acetylmuramoyl-L-alanine amidase [Gemmatimonadaceae bacterium]|nr:N-acetylmuramoyl-L-alanine amidase [Gemmatimonadaceae bacterium]
MPGRHFPLVPVAGLALATACMSSASYPPPATTATPAGAPPTTAVGRQPLPPIPQVDGPLALRVVYPTANAVVTSRDSNFIFGSVGSGRASLTINGVPTRVYPNGAFMAFLANPPADAPRYELVATKGTDTARATHVIRYPTPVVAAVDTTAARAKPETQPTSRADTVAALTARIDSLRTRLTADQPIGWVQLGQPNAAMDTDRTIIGRPIVGGTYKWFFTPGTVVPLLGRTGGMARIRLDRDLDVYVDSADAIDLPADTPAPRRVVSNMRVRGAPLGVDVVMPLGPRVPYFVEERERALVLTLYGARANTDIVNFAPQDSMVRTVEWEQETPERAKITVNLRAAPYGYLVFWENGSLVLRLRGRPAIDAHRPLAGLTIAVDPGHPPGGATGPTGLYEATATLAIGTRLRRILEERGATVLLTRTTDSAIALGDRPIFARRGNVNAFVSIHLNAYPDGVNPFVAPGTGTYFFRTHSEPLARAVQAGMVPQLSLIDLGVNYDNLAVVRGTWYPAILCEGAFVILPDQEAALRTPEYQERYARGVADGVESYFRSLPSR